jgi:SAM-dependent methyltransferase
MRVHQPDRVGTIQGVVMFKRKSASREAEHWNKTEERARKGERLFWLNHPRVAHHYFTRSLVDGKHWRDWVLEQLGGPAEVALELGCGQGAQIIDLVQGGFARIGMGIDLEESRFAAKPDAVKRRVKFVAQDINALNLEPNSYDLIFALQSFHHFENMEHIMEVVERALTPRGFFVLDEFVGPRRFQWTEDQLRITANLLGLMPAELRWYAHGLEKRAEGRSTPEEVIRVCPSEAIRSDEIVPLFGRYFDVVYHKHMGGTIQHLLYSGIVHNFPDNHLPTDHLIDCIADLESLLIERGVVSSDFDLLIGRKRERGVHARS